MAFQFPINPTIGQQVVNTGSSQVFTWNGSSWTQQPGTVVNSISSSFATASFESTIVDTMFRDYFPTRSYATYNWRSAFATPAQLGLTAVGGATVGWYNSGVAYLGQSMLICTATQATTNAAEYTIPTSYIRFETAITPGVSNVFSFTTLTDRTGFVQIDVWVCDPVTGVPVKKLLKNTTEINAASTNYSKTTYLGPWGEYGQTSNGYIWMNYSIPKNLVDQYRSAQGTLKLALRPGVGSAEGGLWYMGGLSMASNPFNFININAGTMNSLFSPAYGLGITWDNGNWNYRSLVNIGANTTGVIYIPILDDTKPMVLSVISAAELAQGFGLQWAEYSLLSPLGATLNIGKSKRSIISPAYLNQNAYTFGIGGWIITPDQLQQYKIPASTWNVNSGYDYLRLAAAPNNQTVTYISGFIAESLY